MAEVKDRRQMVFVSAPWCEPCQRFHQAVDRGELTGKLGQLDLIAFDAEPDAERLLMSGYESRMIPALTVPGADGRATPRHIEGSVSGDGAVADLVPRLLEILNAPALSFFLDVRGASSVSATSMRLRKIQRKLISADRGGNETT